MLSKSDTLLLARRIPVVRRRNPSLREVQIAASAVNQVASHQQLSAPALPAQCYRTGFDLSRTLNMTKCMAELCRYVLTLEHGFQRPVDNTRHNSEIGIMGHLMGQRV